MIQRVIPALACLALTSACSEREHMPEMPRERWSNEAEALFQHAEVLRYTLEQQRLEQQQVQALEPAAQSAPHPPAAQ